MFNKHLKRFRDMPQISLARQRCSEFQPPQVPIRVDDDDDDDDGDGDGDGEEAEEDDDDVFGPDLLAQV